MHTDTHEHTHKHVHAYTHMHTHTHAHAHRHARTHTQTRACIHTHAQHSNICKRPHDIAQFIWTLTNSLRTRSAVEQLYYKLKWIRVWAAKLIDVFPTLAHQLTFSDGGDSTSLGAIIGGVVGALFISALIITVLAVAIRYLIRIRWRSKEHCYDDVDIELGSKIAHRSNAPCTIRSTVPHSSYLKTPTQLDLEESDRCYNAKADQKRSSSAEHAGAISPHTTTFMNARQTLSKRDVSVEYEYVDIPTQIELQGSADFAGYSDPRYRGEVDQERGSSVSSQNKFGDENGYTLPDLCVGNTAAHINTPTSVDLEGRGYCDPCCNDEYEYPLSGISTRSDVWDRNAATHRTHGKLRHSSTPTRADLEDDGYSDPRYRGEVHQERGSSTGSQFIFSDENDYALPDLWGGNASAAAHSNTLTWVDLEGEGYCNPRYYDEVNLDRGSLSDDATESDLCDNSAATQHRKVSLSDSPTRADLKADGYSDPRYYND